MLIVDNMPLGLGLADAVDDETVVTDVLKRLTVASLTVVGVVLESGDVVVLLVSFEVVISVGFDVVAIEDFDDNVEVVARKININACFMNAKYMYSLFTDGFSL